MIEYIILSHINSITPLLCPDQDKMFELLKVTQYQKLYFSFAPAFKIC